VAGVIHHTQGSSVGNSSEDTSSKVTSADHLMSCIVNGLPQKYDPVADAQDMQREHVPDWRINSISRVSAQA
jgi:hypothetical protein